jgi:EAL domain-containing protein (putative c-di-GMP-specific phosphodiesterase class I)
MFEVEHMASGPALVYADLSFPIHRLCNTVGRRNFADSAVPTVDLTPLDRDRVVSRRHAEIFVRGNSVVVVDLGARNGVFVNGGRLAPGEERVLSESDAISFGGVALSYQNNAAWPDGLSAEWATAFESAADVTVASAGTLTGQLHDAVERGELLLHYQPKVTLATGRLEAVECLVRWMHPVRGLLYPDVFLPLAEGTGYIRAMTTWVLETAVLQGAAWRADHLDVHVAINVSTRDLDDNRLAARVDALLHAAKVDPKNLIIEITETGLMADPKRAIDNLLALKSVGVSVSIDDFGIGHSSLAYLKQLPADELKIDKSFTMSLDSNSIAILRSAIQMGHDLGMRVIAEGVETEAAVSLLRELGCDVGQGYHFGRPAPAEVFAQSALAKLIRRGR